MTWKQRKRAWRKAEKDRIMNVRQLCALAGGLACMILICLWVADEKKTDRFGRHDERLFQVMENDQSDKGLVTNEQTPASLATALAAQIPEVERSVSVATPAAADKQMIVSPDDTEIPVNARFAGKDFFNLFAYPLMEGNAGEALSDRKNIVISKTLALRIFHRSSGLQGKSVRYHDQDTMANFEISAVFDNSAVKTSTSIDVLLPYDLYLNRNHKLPEGHNGNLQTYVLLKPGVPVKDFNNKIGQFLAAKNAAGKTTLFAQNFSDRYLHNHYENGKPSGGRIEYVTLFSVVAFVILFIASVNFMNLVTAFANEKTKADAVNYRGTASSGIAGKQTTDNNGSSLAWKIMAESMGLCILALAMALLMVYLSLPAFNAFSGKQLSIIPNAGLILIISVFTALTGLASGAYPAIYFFGLQPLSAVKSHSGQTSDDQTSDEQTNDEHFLNEPAGYRQAEPAATGAAGVRSYPSRRVIEI